MIKIEKPRLVCSPDSRQNTTTSWCGTSFGGGDGAKERKSEDGDEEVGICQIGGLSYTVTDQEIIYRPLNWDHVTLVERCDWLKSYGVTCDWLKF